jgi:hypothetical protein
MMKSSLQQALARQNRVFPHIDRQHLLHKILSTHDAILEFDPATGDLKSWAW